MATNEKKPVHEIPVVAPSDDLWSAASGSRRRAAEPAAAESTVYDLGSPSESTVPSAASAPAAPPPTAPPVTGPVADAGLPPMPPPGSPIPPPVFASGAGATPPPVSVENAYASAPPPPVAASPVAPPPPAATAAPAAAPPPATSATQSAPAFVPSPSMAEQLASVFDSRQREATPMPASAGANQSPAGQVQPERLNPNAQGPTLDPLGPLSSSAFADLCAGLAMVLPSRGSDLHLAAGSPLLVRVDGALEAIPGSVPWPVEHVEAALREMAGEERWSRFEKNLELDMAFSLSDDERFRVNMYQQRGMVGAAFRLIPTEIKQLGELGIADVVSRFAKLPRGLVLVTGPTGSGKSTTLAALIDLVNRTRTDHIVTVEDPIEFLHSNKKALVNQREVGPDTHSFNAALRHVLRQDPDVILIGELRDLETISVALTAAETGHLVFATLHTQDAPQTIDRVIDVFPAHQQPQIRAQLASTLQGVVCQTLIKRASGRGRIVATEIMTMTPAIANLIREGKTYQVHSAMQAGRDDGMHTMDQELAELVNSGKITHEAAIQRAQDVENLMGLIHRANPNAGGR